MPENKKLLVMGASSSHNSINKQFAMFTATQIPDIITNIIDLNDYEMDIFSVDREKDGFPKQTIKFKKQISDADGVIISLAEHNGSYTAAFKNLLDWTSRIESGLWMQKPMFLLSTSNGARGAKTVMDSALNYFPRLGANIIAHFSLPGFRANFSGQQIDDPELRKIYLEQLAIFKDAITKLTASNTIN
ncbi:MAG: NAD(P)H-dependent oxidoreductase [Saprospiraceae bacterium]|nr:NAD(P)H-dependent oxidoreductase [Saprospiraceae bacterium]